jgi:hypothetical protein
MWSWFSWLSPEFPCLLWKVHNCVQVIPPLGSVVNQLNPFRTRTNFSLRSILILACHRHLAQFPTRVPPSNVLRIWIYFSHSRYQTERSNIPWGFFFKFVSNKAPIFQTRLEDRQPCMGFTVRWHQKKLECQTLSFSCLIMHITRQYISSTPSDRSRKSHLSALRIRQRDIFDTCVIRYFMISIHTTRVCAYHHNLYRINTVDRIIVMYLSMCCQEKLQIP